MRDKLKAVFVGLVALPATGFAQADASTVQIYGRVDLSVNSVRFGNGGPHKTTVSSDTSVLGFRGTEDLGGGLSALFKMEMQVAADNGITGATLDLGNGQIPVGAAPQPHVFNREIYVGLRHKDVGQLSLGAHWDPHIWLTARVDPFQRGQMGAIFTLLQGTAARGYATQFVNSIQYLSPQWNGFTGQLNYQLKETTFTQNYGAMAQYAGDRLYAGLAYSNVQVNTAAAALAVSPEARNRNIGAGVAYRFDLARVSAYYQRNTLGALPVVNGLMVGAAVPIKSGEFRISYSRSDYPGRDASMIAVGYNHFLSKRSQVYVTAAKVDNKGLARNGLWPARQDGAVPSAAAQDGRGVQVGIRHVF